MDTSGWLYVIAATVFTIFVIVVAASRFGRIPLGRDGEQRFVAGDPETVLSHSFDPTPREQTAYAVPALRLVVSVVPLEEIDASSAQEVEVL